MSSINPSKTALQSIRSKPSEEIKSYSRRLSREFHIPDTSFDVYYRENPDGIPFLWEIRPGTPKIKTREFPVPPLTPPPSFHATPSPRKLVLNPVRSTPSSSSSSMLRELSQRRRVSDHPRMSFGSSIEEDEVREHVTTLCFRGGKSRGGCSTNIIMRLLLGS